MILGNKTSLCNPLKNDGKTPISSKIHNRGFQPSPQKVKNTKSSILRPIVHLQCCKSTNGLKKWLCKQNNTINVFSKA